MSRFGKPLIIILIILAILAVGGWFFRAYMIKAANFIEPYESITVGATKKVYVAMDNSPWKVEVVQKVVAKLKDKVNFKVENLATLTKLNIAEWDAVVIVAPMYMATLQEDAANFTKATNAKEKILLLGTSGKLEVKADGIETISAASSDADETVGLVTDELNKILKF